MSEKTGLRTGLVVAVLCAAQLMLIVDVVIVNVALPSVRAELDVTPSFLQLTTIAYTVTFGSLLIVVGRAGDLYGRRKVFLAGVAVFTLMSLACGLSQTAWQLFAARAAQGAGAALVSANALALLVGTFPDERVRNRVLGVWAATLSAGAMGGQLLGGVITETVGWRGIFLVNIPIGLLVLALTVRLVPRFDPVGGGRLDLAGALMLTVALGGGSLLLGYAGQGVSVPIVIGFVVVLGVMAAFVLTERRIRDPLLPRHLLARRNVVVANLILALNAGAVGASLYFTTLNMQTEMGYGPLQTGLGFAPITAIVLLVSSKVGWLMEKLGARLMLVLGAVFGVSGTVLLALSSGGGSYWTSVLPGLSLVALGSGFAYAPTLSLATAVPEPDQGVASGLVNTSQEIGTAAVLAVLAAVAAAAATSTAAGLTNYPVGYFAAAAAAGLAGAIALATPARKAGEPAGETAGSVR
ncbi:MFS transporter [Nonomuraea typhae]|uniref:MFS transporter n=1 Tax=Nonomuraea typhae TaxID=2603600 RepID=A0ABW7Z9J4_9ACTN